MTVTTAGPGLRPSFGPGWEEDLGAATASPCVPVPQGHLDPLCGVSPSSVGSRKDPERIMPLGLSARDRLLPIWEPLYSSKAASWVGMLLERAILGVVAAVGLTGRTEGRGQEGDGRRGEVTGARGRDGGVGGQPVPAVWNRGGRPRHHRERPATLTYAGELALRAQGRGERGGRGQLGRGLGLGQPRNGV